MGMPITMLLTSSSNLSKTKLFYEKVFEWKMTLTGSYVSADPQGGGGDPGGLVWLPGPELEGWVPCVQVTDLTKTLNSVQDNGGSVVESKVELEGKGTFAIIKDPTGAYLGLWLPK